MFDEATCAESFAVVALVVFASLGTASAECAWALWVKGTSVTEWQLAAATPAWYASKDDCTSTATYKQAGLPSQHLDVMCLPQGVDPTGSAGSYKYRVSGARPNEAVRSASGWVLWGAQRPHDADTDAKSWWVQAAYPTREECEGRRGFVHRRRAADSVSYECLPDTVDPRGPKGK